MARPRGIKNKQAQQFVAPQNQIPPPTDVSLEFVNGDLVVTWTKPPGYDHPCLYRVKVKQWENKVSREVITELTEFKIPDGEYDPGAHYIAIVSAGTSDGTDEESMPVATDPKIRYKQLTSNVYVDDSCPLREGYKVYIGYMVDALDQWKKVAVKVVEGRFLREISHLENLQCMENVVSYKTSGKLEGIGQQAFIVMELCDEDNLYDMLGKGLLIDKPGEVKNVLVHIMQGLSQIHEISILHRDLKLTNVLRSLDKKRMKICDFGLSKKFRDNKSKVSKSTMDIGTEGWGSPEHYGDNKLMSRKSDIFSAGLIFCYVLSGGKHAYGDSPYRWKPQIIDEVPISLPDFKCDDPDLAADLVNKMLQYNPNDRPDSGEVLAHPFFWSNERKLDFIHHANTYIQGTLKKPIDHTIARRILTDLKKITDDFNDWGGKLSREPDAEYLFKMVKGEAKRRVGKYDPTKFKELVRFLRNVAEHHEGHEELTPLFNKKRASVWIYFSKIFPKLLPGLFNIFSKHLHVMKEIPELNNVREVLMRRVEYAPLELP